MLLPLTRSGLVRCAMAFLAVFLLFSTSASPVQAQVTAFKQAVAEAASRDKDIAAFYQATNYKAIWTTNNSSRRNALLNALADAPSHGLPTYDVDALKAKMKAARNPRDRGLVEVELSRVFLDYSTSLQTGVLVPAKVISEIKRQVPYRERVSYLTNFAKSNPGGFFRALRPKSPEYGRLMKEKIRLERQMGAGGWGAAVAAKSLKPGDQGNAVLSLRNRLISMGYLNRSNAVSYDGNIQKAVQQFQISHGLNPDGVAGPSTIEQLNIPPEERLKSVLVAMERERWMNMDKGQRHILVNLTDFTAKIVENDQVTFETRSVIGARDADRRTPEFSDEMETLVINPTWNVPRSITVKEYLPMLKRNRNAASHLRIVDRNGRTVPRSAINFSAYSNKSFPYSMKQPPSDGNALGLVKFLFPNRYNIYLHDTPTKHLFAREVRAYSHGCIRLADPFDFAYALLAKQEKDPVGFFQARLKSGRETPVALEKHVPVHIIYRTAFVPNKGRANYRDDIYGRDRAIWNALAKAGVELRAVRG